MPERVHSSEGLGLAAATEQRNEDGSHNAYGEDDSEDDCCDESSALECYCRTGWRNGSRTKEPAPKRQLNGHAQNGPQERAKDKTRGVVEKCSGAADEHGKCAEREGMFPRNA